MDGILFKPDMIQAIIEGRKTQTRRIMKPQPYLKDGLWFWSKGKRIYALQNQGEISTLLLGVWSVTPYHIGQTIYIKEAIKVHGAYAEDDLKSYLLGYMVIYPDNTPKMVWAKDLPQDFIPNPFYQKMFMPAWAARYFIQITEVRPERLLDISNNDACLEGINGVLKETIPNHVEMIDYRTPYFELWDSINPKYPSSSNPWLWRYEFIKVNKLNE